MDNCTDCWQLLWASEKVKGQCFECEVRREKQTVFNNTIKRWK